MSFDTESEESKSRFCVYCEKQFKLEKGKYFSSFYCSKQCAYNRQLENNKNPYSTYGESDWRDANLKRDGVPTSKVDQEILQKAEENEGEIDMLGQNHIVEDTEEIFKIIFEELNSPKMKETSQNYYARKAQIKRAALKKKNNKTSPLDRKTSKVKLGFKYSIK